MWDSCAKGVCEGVGGDLVYRHHREEHYLRRQGKCVYLEVSAR